MSASKIVKMIVRPEILSRLTPHRLQTNFWAMQDFVITQHSLKSVRDITKNRGRIAQLQSELEAAKIQMMKVNDILVTNQEHAEVVKSVKQFSDDQHEKLKKQYEKAVLEKKIKPSEVPELPPKWFPKVWVKDVYEPDQTSAQKNEKLLIRWLNANVAVQHIDIAKLK